MCGEALVFLCGRALRWDICLKSIVVARLTFLCFCGFRVLNLYFGVGVCFVWLGWTGRRDVGLWDSSVCVFLVGSIAVCECSFPFFVLVLIAFWRGWVVKSVMLFDGRVRGCWIL